MIFAESNAIFRLFLYIVIVSSILFSYKNLCYMRNLISHFIFKIILIYLHVNKNVLFLTLITV